MICELKQQNLTQANQGLSALRWCHVGKGFDTLANACQSLPANAEGMALLVHSYCLQQLLGTLFST
jgi:hypothetical protein